MMNLKTQAIKVTFLIFCDFMLLTMKTSKLLWDKMLQKNLKLTSPDIQKDIVNTFVVDTINGIIYWRCIVLDFG